MPHARPSNKWIRALVSWSQTECFSLHSCLGWGKDSICWNKETVSSNLLWDMIWEVQGQSSFWSPWCSGYMFHHFESHMLGLYILPSVFNIQISPPKEVQELSCYGEILWSRCSFLYTSLNWPLKGSPLWALPVSEGKIVGIIKKCLMIVVRIWRMECVKD